MSDEKNSNRGLPVSRTALQDSKDESISGNSGPVATGGSAEIHDRTGLYISIIALLVAGIALGMIISSSSQQKERYDAVLRDNALKYEIAMRDNAQKFEAASKDNERNSKLLWDKYQITEREARLAQDDITKHLRSGK